MSLKEKFAVRDDLTILREIKSIASFILLFITKRSVAPQAFSASSEPPGSTSLSPFFCEFHEIDSLPLPLPQFEEWYIT